MKVAYQKTVLQRIQDLHAEQARNPNTARVDYIQLTAAEFKWVRDLIDISYSYPGMPHMKIMGFPVQVE